MEETLVASKRFGDMESSSARKITMSSQDIIQSGKEHVQFLAQPLINCPGACYSTILNSVSLSVSIKGEENNMSLS